MLHPLPARVRIPSPTRGRDEVAESRAAEWKGEWKDREMRWSGSCFHMSHLRWKHWTPTRTTRSGKGQGCRSNGRIVHTFCISHCEHVKSYRHICVRDKWKAVCLYSVHGPDERYSSCHGFVTMVTVALWYTLNSCIIQLCNLMNYSWFYCRAACAEKAENTLIKDQNFWISNQSPTSWLILFVAWQIEKWGMGNTFHLSIHLVSWTWQISEVPISVLVYGWIES